MHGFSRFFGKSGVDERKDGQKWGFQDRSVPSISITRRSHNDCRHINVIDTPYSLCTNMLGNYPVGHYHKDSAESRPLVARPLQGGHYD